MPTRPSDEHREQASATLDDDAQRRAEYKLIGRVSMGDKVAFETLYHRYSPRLGSFLWRMLGDRDLVEEAVSDTMLAVWHGAERFDARVRLITWIFAIGRHKGLKLLNRRTRQQYTTARNDDDESLIGNLADPDTPERALARRERIEQLSHALEGLSPEQRQTLELAFIEGLSYQEIAAVVGCPTNTVKTRIFHARKRLTQQLARRAKPSITADRAGRRP